MRKARQRREQRLREKAARYRAARHRSPSAIAAEPGGDRDRSDGPVYDYVPTYMVNGKPKLAWRVNDHIDPERDPRAQVWVRKGPRISPDIDWINGRSDRATPGSTSRTLRPAPPRDHGSLKPGAIDLYFDGQPAVLTELGAKDGWSFSRRSMARADYRAVGR